MKFNFFKQIFHLILNYKEFVLVRNGIKKFEKDNIYEEKVYFTMIDLFCKSNGHIFDYIQNKILKIKTTNNSHLIGYETTCIEKTDKIDYDLINLNLNNNGYVELGFKLDKLTINSLVEFSKNVDKYIREDLEPKSYSLENPIYSSYYVPRQVLVSNALVQELIMSKELISIARNYLGCEPIFDFAALWISPKIDGEPTMGAQEYHFDLDRIKWLKIFIYLSDVDSSNGPHVYVSKSHISGSKPKQMLTNGYSRVSDNEINAHYSNEDIVEVTGQAGTMFAGDTKCWHKGKVIEKGERIVLQLEFTSSLFGGNVGENYIENPTEKFKLFCNQNQHYTSNIKIIQNA